MHSFIKLHYNLLSTKLYDIFQVKVSWRKGRKDGRNREGGRKGGRGRKEGRKKWRLECKLGAREGENDQKDGCLRTVC